MCQLNIEQVRIDQVSFKHLTIEQNCSVVICSIIICSIIICSNSISSEGMQGNYYILQNSWFGSIVAWIIVVWIKGWKSSMDDRFAEHYSPLWFGSRHEMLSRVRGNYYILQNSWFGSIVAWIIVVWIKGWKLPRDDRFAEHYSPLWFGSKHESHQGLEEIITTLQQLNYSNWNTAIELQQLNYLLVQ